jgi:hypothetical protein
LASGNTSYQKVYIGPLPPQIITLIYLNQDEDTDNNDNADNLSSSPLLSPQLHNTHLTERHPDTLLHTPQLTVSGSFNGNTNSSENPLLVLQRQVANINETIQAWTRTQQSASSTRSTGQSSSQQIIGARRPVSPSQSLSSLRMVPDTNRRSIQHRNRERSTLSNNSSLRDIEVVEPVILDSPSLTPEVQFSTLRTEGIEPIDYIMNLDPNGIVFDFSY